MLIKILSMLCIFMMTFTVYATNTDMIDRQIESLNLMQLDNTLIIENSNYGDFFKNITLSSIARDLMQGGWKWDISLIIKRGFAFYMKEVYANIKLMLILIVLAIISSLLTNLQSSFQREGIAETAFYICYAVMIGIAVRGFSFAVESSMKLIESLTLYIKSLVPIVMSISLAGGNISGATMFQPSILISTQLISIIASEILIPFLMVAVCIAIVNNLSNKMHLNKMVELIKKSIKWGLGILLTIFASIMMVQGLIAPAMDGAAGKSIKFAISNFIPIVGGILSDSINVVVGHSLMLKNIIGTAGMIITALICFEPLVKIIALVTIFYLTAAVIQPISDKRLPNSITEIASAMSTLALIIVSIELMFLVNLTIAVLAGGSAAALGR